MQHVWPEKSVEVEQNELDSLGVNGVPVGTVDGFSTTPPRSHCNLSSRASAAQSQMRAVAHLLVLAARRSPLAAVEAARLAWRARRRTSFTPFRWEPSCQISRMGMG
jgi:hypothetical protein